MDIWNQCEGPKHIGPIKGTLCRLVESQQHIATLELVDTLEEQAILESLLETSKPPYPSSIEAYDYLLKTPFRYPPLKWGSRFGRTHEPSLCYGAKELHTVLAESAYYRLIFWHSMDGDKPSIKLNTEHTLFSVGYRTEQGICLQDSPFNQFRAHLKNPRDYRDCQALGSDMREAGVVVFEYESARDSRGGICVALFKPEGFSTKRPRDKQQWHCELTAEKVTFKKANSLELYQFGFDDFALEGALPYPAD